MTIELPDLVEVEYYAESLLEISSDLLRPAVRMTHSVPDAEEAVRSAFRTAIKLFAAGLLDRVDDPLAFAVTLVRRETMDVVVSKPAWGEHLVAAVGAATAQGVLPLELRDPALATWRALGELSPRHAAAVTLTRVYGYSTELAGEALECSADELSAWYTAGMDGLRTATAVTDSGAVAAVDSLDDLRMALRHHQSVGTLSQRIEDAVADQVKLVRERPEESLRLATEIGADAAAVAYYAMSMRRPASAIATTTGSDIVEIAQAITVCAAALRRTGRAVGPPLADRD
ncbi:RNA polymerase sigma factor, sigma-70 family [Aeromicrobium marinum DSM 15272]|uniref:RNA polymerase sigma factor, sigma-70 family n=1 Tax=Aeromicrobium marinum DSM 15272 TaxID=585531 RepID=E2S7X5_9ACTN|nr:hypothetical protein [Aeromicrobium marinum]EFQ84791.1 RNA polymerase sigma factor, sigma-70 family [Aeromicrobium marinum DSM 15272]